MSAEALSDADAEGRTWPPPPHDPRERELAIALEGWEVRLFGGRKFQYFVTRGFWHVQLWHPEARISVLTLSRPTCGFFEVYPVDDGKAQAHDYEALAALVAGLGGPAIPSWPRLHTILRAFIATSSTAQPCSLLSVP